MWITLPALAALRLPGFPGTAWGWHKLARRGRWQRAEWRWPVNPDGRWRQRAGAGGGIEFRDDVLPERARKMLLARTQTAAPAPETPPPPPETTEPGEGTTLLTDAGCGLASDGTGALTEDARVMAAARLCAVWRVEDLINGGAGTVDALRLVADAERITVSTLQRWRVRARVQKGTAIEAMADKRGRCDVTAEVDPDAWSFYLGDYLRPAKPAHAACYRRLSRAAEQHGWAIPSAATLKRRVEREISAAVIVLSREGERALARLYPAQQRSRASLGALEWVNADGHTFDVFVRFADGRIGRPCLVAFQDVYSGMILSHRLGESEHRDLVRLTFGDLIERYGVPDDVLLDNGRAFASKWLSGGTPTRYRFKVRPEDPVGLFCQLECRVHWATPFHGQAKPVERAFRDLAEDIARHPACAGAYTGNNPQAKPADYGSRALDFADFERLVAREIAAHNTRTGRRSEVCAGRSLAQAFEDSYRARVIRKASAEQRRLWLLATEGVTARADDGAIYLAGNRYWAEFLTAARGQRLVARLDPAALHSGLEIEQLDGGYLGRAPCVEATGFADQTAAREHARARRDYVRAVKAQAAAEGKLSAAEVAALIPAPEMPAPPAAGVVKPIFGATPRNDVLSREEFERGWSAAITRLRAIGD